MGAKNIASMRPVIILKTDAHEDGDGVVNNKVYLSAGTLKEDLMLECDIHVDSDEMERSIDDCDAGGGTYLFLEDFKYVLLVMRLVDRA